MIKPLTFSIKFIEILTASFLLFSVACNGQKVPKPVNDALKSKFPEAESVKWDKESENEYEAEFKLEEVSYSANFAVDGTWLETEIEMSKDDLPQAVKETLERDYPEAEVSEVAKITNNKNETLYEVEIGLADTEKESAMEEDDDDEYEERTTDLIFNETGELVKKSGVEKDDED